MGIIDTELKEKIRIVCNALLKEHLDMKRFVAGFGNVEPCGCPACKAAIELMEKVNYLCE